MILKILFWLFIIIGTINLLHFAFYLVGANIYDIQALKRANLRKKSNTRRARNPLVSVLVPAYNESKVIGRCLDSIRKSTYKKVQIVVNDDASKDDTAKIVRAYQKRYPKLDLRLVSRRHNAGKASGLNYIARRYAKGELVMTLDADSVIHNDAIKKAVGYFDDPSVNGVAANVRIMEEPSILGLLQRFEHLISYRAKKLYTVANCELIVGGVASTYRNSVLKQVRYYDTDTVTEDIGLSIKIISMGNRENKMVYAADVAAATEPVLGFRPLITQRYRWKLGSLQNLVKYRHIAFSSKQYTKTLSWYRVPMAFMGELMLLLEPIALGYIAYVSITYLTWGFFMSAYFAITLYILLTIWPDEHMPFWIKVRSSLLAPFLYGVFYLMNIVQLISAVRCIVNVKHITRLVKHENPWVSPARVGKAANFS